MFEMIKISFIAMLLIGVIAITWLTITSVDSNTVNATTAPTTINQTQNGDSTKIAAGG
jgi:hypothetical protein